MRLAVAAYLQKLIVAAGAVTGKKFGLLVASSLIATTGIVSATLNSSNGINPLAAAAAAALLEEQPSAVTASAPVAPAPEEAFSPAAAPEPTPSV
jgi:hypothetical protein